MTLTIENEYIRLSVKEEGGSMTSVFDKKRNTEMLYQPKENSWQGQDIFIFPFVARLVDGTYTYNGKEYALKNHGLLRYSKGKGCINKDGDIEISFASDEESLKRYPFPFKATARYHLEKNQVHVFYTMENTGEEQMPYMVGGHPAFKVPGKETADGFDFEGTYLTFPKVEKLYRVEQEETFSFNTGISGFGTTQRINLDKALFNKINTVILVAEDFDQVTLHKLDGSTLTMHKEKAPFLALWSDKKYGDYVAIEPWYGIPDTLPLKKEITQKAGINFLSPQSAETVTYWFELD